MTPRYTQPIRSRPAAIPAIFIAAGFVLTSGLMGGIAAATLLITWYVLPEPFPYLIGQAGVPIAFSLTAPLLLLGVELALVTMLVLGTQTQALGTTGLTILVGSIVLVGFSRLLQGVGWSRPEVSLLAMALLILGSYLLHRYTLIRLGKLTEEQA